MRQQEANQFDKGLSLDTNAIAMDNHTLSGALNATMITMNGNELVLQNDMGNAKVESAYLPSGYVPVGMQEFGGIVYVASYNPFEKKSQIGCFPSPERNISGSELGQAGCAVSDLLGGNRNTVIGAVSSRSQLIKGPIRPGDKFVITSSNAGDLVTGINNDLLDFKVLVLDADGSGIDITKDMNKFNSGPLGFIYNGSTPSDDKFTTYKQKIAGSIWVQESLILPAYITVSITSTAIENSNNVKVEFNATAYDSDGLPWSVKHQQNITEGGLQFAYAVNGNDLDGDNFVTVERGQGIVLTYSVVPQYSFGRIKLLEQTGNVAVDLLGSGNIDIPVVRYYNDILNDQFSLEYTINAYVENSKHSVSKVYLEFYDYKDCTVSEDPKSITLPSQAKQILLSTSNTFGSYTTLIPYADSSEGAMLLKGHMYIARLVAERSTVDVSGTVPYASEWFTIITSAITNRLYMSNPSASVLSGDSAHQILLDWDINWEETKHGENGRDSTPAALNTGVALPTTLPQDGLIKLQTIREGEVIMKYKAEVEVNTIDSNFPFDILTSAVVSIPGADASVAEQTHTTFSTVIETTGGKINQQGLITSEEKNALWVDPGDPEHPNYDNNVWSAVTNSPDDVYISEEDGSLQRTLHYRLKSQLFAALANDGHALTYTGSDIPALVPLQTLRSQDEDDIRTMVGSEFFATYNGDGQITSAKPQAWWVWGTYEGKKHARERQMAFMQAPSDYSGSGTAVGSIPAQEELTDDGYGLFRTSTTNAAWRFYSTVTMDYLHNDLKMYPYLFFWQGANDSSCAFSIDKGTKIKDYTMPIMTDAAGEMFIIGQYKTGSGHANTALLNIIKCLSKIYVYQQGQTVTYEYYKASDALADYIYTNTYQAKIACRYKATPTITFVVDKDAETPIEYVGGAYTLVGKDATINLPTFARQEFSAKGSDEKVFTITVNSPDQSAANLEYLDAQPSVGNVAIIKDGTTANPAIVSTAVRITEGQEDGVEPLDISHPYLAYSGSGSETKLCDCMKPLPSSIANSTTLEGKGLADALRNRFLRIMYSSENERNIIVVNRSTVSSVTGSATNVYIGSDDKITNLAQVAPKHVLKLPLFTNMSNMTITN